MKTFNKSSEAYLESSQTSKMKYFAIIVNGFKLWTSFAEISILDVWLVFECACELK